MMDLGHWIAVVQVGKYARMMHSFANMWKARMYGGEEWFLFEGLRAGSGEKVI